AQMEQSRTRMRTWVSRSMDLGAATKRTSTRFNRTSYVEQSSSDTLRLPTERLGAAQEQAPVAGQVQRRAAVQVAPAAARAVAQAEPIHMVFRDGAGHLKFQKTKEVRAHAALAEAEAIQLARDFLNGNSLLKQTGSDKVGRVYVQERRISEDRGAGQTSDDYLVQQDVVFEREVEGQPVINSKIVVGFQPDTRDILLLEHFNWTPIQQQVADQSADPPFTLPRSMALTRATAPLARRVAAQPDANLRSRVEAKIRAVSGDKFTRAEVVGAMRAWFQTEDRLVPVLVFETEVTFPSERGPITEPYVELINLAGSDDVLYPGRRRAEAPAQAPGRALLQQRQIVAPRARVVR
ncbi:MAG: hypothetical protein MUQ26_08960, partial [Armatimonadetes bacterium]|nr:hypothetical protein [Armatimonadota bacterium]